MPLQRIPASIEDIKSPNNSIQSSLDEDEVLKHCECDTTLQYNGVVLGKGTLCLTDRRIFWQSPDASGVSIDYPSVALHAACPESSSEKFTAPCVYCQVVDDDAPVEEAEEEIEEDEEDSATNDLTAIEGKEEEVTDVDRSFVDDDFQADQKISELRFAPKQAIAVDTIFRVMTEMAALNPDPNDCQMGLSDDEDDDIDHEVDWGPDDILMEEDEDSEQCTAMPPS